MQEEEEDEEEEEEEEEEEGEGGEKEGEKEGSEISLFSKTHTSNTEYHSNGMSSIMFMQSQARCKYSLCGLVANSLLVGRGVSVFVCVCADSVYGALHQFTT